MPANNHPHKKDNNSKLKDSPKPPVTTKALVKVEKPYKKPESLIDRIINIEVSGKTFIFSHLALLAFGLIFLFGMYYVLNEGKIFCCNEDKFQNYLPVTKKPSSIELNITGPDEDSLLYESSTIFKGKTTSKAILLITNLTTDENLGFEADTNGDFSKIVTLEEGLNEFQIVAFDSEGNKKTETRTLYYSKEKLQ